MRYGIAVGAAVAAIAVRLLLDPVLGVGTFPFLTLFLALIVVAWFAGPGPAGVTLLLGGLGAFYFLLTPQWQLTLEGPAAAGLLVYLVTGGGCVFFGHRLIQARRRADENARALEEANQRKDEFLAILAHELRNPLSPILTGLELLRLSEDKAAALGRIRPMLERQVHHMVRLIDDLLDVSRITSGRIQLQRRPTPLADLVDAAIDANRAALDAGGLTLTVDLPARPCVLDVDSTRFVQVLTNLLQNAVKFTDAGGEVTLRAVIDEHSSPPALTLTIKDTGIGIAPEKLHRIFDLFMQGDAAGRGKGGLGIGLALARRLVDMHGGRIDAHSDGPGRGSTFTIRLPVTMPSAVAGAPLARERPDRISRRVLIVDDNVDAAETLAQLVVALGGESLTAASGQEGVRSADHFRPDVVLLDLGMPGMDGYETCRRLRAEPFGRSAFIVALTGWGQEQDRRRVLEEGFDAHLTKPADTQTLASLLSKDPAA